MVDLLTVILVVHLLTASLKKWLKTLTLKGEVT